MIGQPTTMPDLKSITIGATAALVSAICLIAPAAAQADGLRAPEMDTVNGQPCNTLCKAYMAWSDRVLAVTQPSYVRPQVRVAVPQNPTPKKLEKPERMANHAPKSTRPSNLDSFAQLPSGAHAAQSGMDMRRGDDTLGEYGNVTMGRPLPDDPISPAALARLHGTSPEPDMRLVSMARSGFFGGSNGSSVAHMQVHSDARAAAGSGNQTTPNGASAHHGYCPTCAWHKVVHIPTAPQGATQ